MTLHKMKEFAALAGVTVKALRHYERVGLLKPRRTRAGHRRYAHDDLDRLEAIGALKYVGFSLDQVRAILNRPGLELRNAIADRRRAISEAEARLAVARKAIDLADQPADARAGLNVLVETVQIQVAATAMKRYYTEDGFERRRRYYEDGPAAEWRELYATLSALVGQDPASETVQAAVDRWLALSIRAYTGDPTVQTDSPTAWADRDRWPLRMKRRIEEFHLEEVHALVAEAARQAPRKYFTAAAWNRYIARRNDDPEPVSRAWRARVDLFREIAAALEAGLAERQAEAFRARWDQQLDAASGGDPEVHEGLVRMWADREHWSASLRWQVEAIHWMPYERLQKIAAFLERPGNNSHGRGKVRIPTAGNARV